jgi:hypothetical protein
MSLATCNQLELDLHAKLRNPASNYLPPKTTITTLTAAGTVGGYQAASVKKKPGCIRPSPFARARLTYQL